MGVPASFENGGAMSTKVPGVLADVAIGCLLAGVIVGALVPMAGGVVGPATALGVAAASVVAALVAGRWWRRPRESGG